MITELPVYLAIDTSGIDEFIAAIIAREGALRIRMCPVCFVLVPVSRFDDHSAVGHGKGPA